MPTARGFARVAVVGGKIFVLGGGSTNAERTANEVYDPATDTWTTREPLPTNRTRFSVAVLNNKIYVIGGGDGFDINGTGLQLVEEHDALKVDPNPSPFFPNDTWTRRNPIANKRTSAPAAVVNDKIYVIGGLSADSNGSFVKTVEEGILSAAPDLNFPVRNSSFGDVIIGNTAELNLTVQNRGDAVLTTSVVNLTDPAGEIRRYREPGDIAAGGTGVIKIRFTPTSPSVKTYNFRLDTNDPDTPSVTFTITGTGAASPPTPDNLGTWQVIQNLPLDPGAFYRGVTVKDGKAYVGKGKSGNPPSLAIIDLTTGMELKTIPLYPGSYAQRIAISSGRAYVTLGNLGSDSKVAVISLDGNTVSQYISTGADPRGIAAYNGKLYVTSDVVWTNGDPATTSVFNETTFAKLKSIPVGIKAHDVVVDPITGRAYIINLGIESGPNSEIPSASKSVSVLDTVSDTVIATIPAPFFPSSMAIVGTKGYLVTNSSLEIIDLLSNQIVNSVPLAEYSGEIVATPENIFVLNFLREQVTILDATNYRTVGSVAVKGPTSMALDPATNNVYVISAGDNSIKMIRRVKPGFTLSCNPSNLAVVKGGSTQVSCSVTSLDGFSQPVSLGCAGLPGINCGFSNSLVQSAVVNANESNRSIGANADSTSTLTINVPANVVPGAYTFKAVGTGNNQTDQFKMTITVPTCDYAVTPSERSHGAGTETGSFDVMATSDCTWTAVSNNNWLTITSGSSGTSSGTVNYSVTANLDPISRTGTITVAGRTFTITQAGKNASFPLPLTIGWNLIALPFQPTNPAITNVLAEINGKYDRVFAYNNATGGYLSYNPSNPAASLLFTMEAGRGYWIRMNTASQLTVSGADPSKSVVLELGWNLVSYNGATPKAIAEALAPIAGKYARVYGWNSLQGRYEKYVASNPGQSDLFTLEPGKGYFIFATEKTTWTLP